MRLVGAVAALLRRVRAERGAMALVFVVVAVTSFAVAAGPRLFNRVADDGLRHDVARATAIGRNLQFSTVGRLASGSAADPFARIAARGESLRSGLPASVEALVEKTRFVIDTPRFQVGDPPKFTTYVAFRQQGGLEGLVDVVDGRWPARVEPPEPLPPDAPARFEIALSTAAAATVGAVVGDTFTVTPDPNDGLLQNQFRPVEKPIEIELVGLFEIRDLTDPDWFADRSLADAGIGGTEDAPIAFAVAVFAPAAYRDLLGLGLPSRYRWNLFVDPSRLDAGRLDTLVPDLRRLASTYTTVGSVRTDSISLRSGLLGIIERYRAQRMTTEAALSLAAIGPLVVAAGAVGLIAILVVRRRRRSLSLARGRGASSGQLLAAQLWEGLLVTVPAALLGLVAALAVVDARPSWLSSTGAILVALGATLILILATWPSARRARRDLERDDPPTLRVSPRRLVFEILVVALSLVAAWLLRERGLSGATAAGATRGFDPFLAASPMLVGLAVGLITIRLYPIPIRGLGWLMARRSDLIPVLGLRALGRHPSDGYLPLLILTMTVAIGTLSTVLLASIERSQTEISWLEVGADFRVESTSDRGLDPGIDPRALEGVEAVAAGFIATNAAMSATPRDRSRVILRAVEPAAYDAVVAGSPLAVGLSSTLAASPTGPDAGTRSAPIPAIVSTWRPAGSPPIAADGLFTVSLPGRTLTFRSVGRLDAFPGIGSSAAFIIAPFESVAAGWGGTPLRPSVLLVRGPASLEAPLRAASAGAPDTTVVVSRRERFAEMREAPLVAAVAGGFALAIAVTSAFASLSVVTVVALQAGRRSREIAFLRTLGLTERQVNQLTVVEQGIPLIVALAIGVGLGLGLASLLEPGLDLAAFSRLDAIVDVQADPISIAVVALSIVTVVAVAVAISSRIARRLDVDNALRIGEV
jgi:putative ABC transport system permease protein